MLTPRKIAFHIFGKLMFLSVFIAGFAGTASSVDGADITVSKSATETNPPLYIKSLDMPGEAESLMHATLRRCGWFKLVTSDTDGAFVLTASHKDAERQQLKVEVRQDGERIAAFTVKARSENLRRLVYRAVDTVIEKIFDTPGPCDSRIAFVAGKEGRKEIFTCNFDGSEVKQLTYNGTISTEPGWSHDGRYLVYTFYDGDRTKTVLIDMKGGRQRVISAYRGLNSGAAFSPDNKNLTLSLSRGGDVDIYLKPRQGNQLKKLTSGSATEASPCWSPDGKAICFVSDRAGNPRLYKIPASGGNARRILTGTAEEVSPDWSPETNQIVYSTRREGRYRIAVADMNDDNPRGSIVPTPEGRDWESPSWAPDGRHVVCTRSGNGRSDLYIVDTLTGNATSVLQGAKVSLPAWTSR